MARSVVTAAIIAAFVCLPGCHGFHWSPSPADGAVIHACAGDDVLFRWELSVGAGEEASVTEWRWGGHPVATEHGGHFTALPPLSPRLSLLGTHGLRLSDVTPHDAGSYQVAVLARDGHFDVITLTHQAQLYVSGPGHLGLELTQESQAGLDPLTGRWAARLTCGHFSFPDTPDFDVTWTLPSGSVALSTFYSNGTFTLLLPTPLEKGNYSCHLPASKGALCFQSGQNQTSSLTLDMTLARLSIMEAEQKERDAENRQMALELRALRREVSDLRGVRAELAAVRQTALLTETQLVRQNVQLSHSVQAVERLVGGSNQSVWRLRQDVDGVQSGQAALARAANQLTDQLSALLNDNALTRQRVTCNERLFNTSLLQHVFLSSRERATFSRQLLECFMLRSQHDVLTHHQDADRATTIAALTDTAIRLASGTQRHVNGTQSVQRGSGLQSLLEELAAGGNHLLGLTTLERRVETLETAVGKLCPSCQPPQTFNIPADCVESGRYNSQSGVVTISPDGRSLLRVYCDHTTDNGGWTVFQFRSSKRVSFKRGWKEYGDGFGNPETGDFWLGLDALHAITSRRRQTVRIDLLDWDGVAYFALYSNFTVAASSDNYRLSLGQYLGGTAGNGFSAQNGSQFSTIDMDNDLLNGSSCAQRFPSGWWHAACFRSNLNGIYVEQPNTTYAIGLMWFPLKGFYHSFKMSRIEIRPE